MSVKLVTASNLWIVAGAIRHSHYTLDGTDSFVPAKSYKREATCKQCGTCLNVGEDELYCSACDKYYNKEQHIGFADFNLIRKVGFHLNHSSVLEQTMITFDVEMSTKALLEESRHRIGLSQTVTSSRYALDKIEIKFEPSPRVKVQQGLETIKQIVTECLEAGEPLDEVAMLLPQAFIYELRLSMNLRSLAHFLDLRLAKAAHRTIRKVAVEMVEALPEDYKELLFDYKKGTIYKKYTAEYNKPFRKGKV